MHLSIPDKRAALLGLTLFSAQSLAVCNGADNARVSVDSLDEGSPVYSASLLQKESTPVRGTMTVASAMNSIGVDVTLMLTGLPGPDEEGYVYHINELPVPANGSCSSTGDIFDPYSMGKSEGCSPENRASCRVGDLSGKHGHLSAYNHLMVYNDNYLSLNPRDPAFIGDRAFVVSMKNGTAINCGNIAQLGGQPEQDVPQLLPTATTSSFASTLEPTSSQQQATDMVTVTATEDVHTSLVSTRSATRVTSGHTTRPSSLLTMTRTNATSTAATTATATGHATGLRSICSIPMTGATGLVTVASGSYGVRATGTAGTGRCGPVSTATTTGYHSPTVSSPASDARSVQLGRSGFKVVVSVMGALMVVLL